MERIFFYLTALIILVFAVMAVNSRNMMRTIIYLLFTLIGIAALYFMMAYNFLAAVQLSVYAGGIIVLYVNSIMLIEKIGIPMEKPKRGKQILIGLLSALAFGLTLFAIYTYPFDVAGTTAETTVEQVGKALLSYGDNGYVLPFELISILLLAAMIGAIVIAKTVNHKKSES